MKSTLSRLFISISLICALFACTEEKHSISVTNPSDFDRNNETITVDIKNLKLPFSEVNLVETKSGIEIRSQIVDSDKDALVDRIIFQCDFNSNETKQFTFKNGGSTLAPNKVKTFARFAPERIDDFAWENDKVAFRVYGPTAQQLANDGKKNGTLSSGVDCWLKKVDYPIIDKWYAGFVKQKGYYHKDHGEGLDNYHVGPSRGCGGSGVMSDAKLISSLNYTDYNIITNGPLKTEFELEYAPYKAADKVIKESKTVSIVLGENFTKYVIDVEGTDTLTTGITLHDNLGITSVDTNACWINYWSPHFGEELGTSIVVNPRYFAGYSKIESDVKDESHILLHLKAIDGKVEYYSGFTWSGSEQFSGNVEWGKYLSSFATKITSEDLILLVE